MARPRLPRPTDTELSILRVLWERGPSTVREIHDALAHGRDAVYTSTAKVLQIMADKGLTTREDWGRVHRYSAATTEEDTQRQLVEDLLERAFGGSSVKLMQRALDAKRTSARDLAEIRKLLEGSRRRTR
jgi:predicted transcriptional regulator